MPLYHPPCHLSPSLVVWATSRPALKAGHLTFLSTPLLSEMSVLLFSVPRQCPVGCAGTPGWGSSHVMPSWVPAAASVPWGQCSSWHWGVAVNSAVVSPQSSLFTVKNFHTVLCFFETNSLLQKCPWGSPVMFKSRWWSFSLISTEQKSFGCSICVLCSCSYFCPKNCSCTACFTEFRP